MRAQDRNTLSVCIGNHSPFLMTGAGEEASATRGQGIVRGIPSMDSHHLQKVEKHRASECEKKDRKRHDKLNRDRHSHFEDVGRC